MTTDFDRWVSVAIQDLGGDGAKYLREKSNVVSLTDWKSSRYNGRVNAGKHDELNPLRVWLSGAEMPFCLPAESQTPKRVFCFLGSDHVRHVSGMVLNNLATRASQSEDGGLRIEPGGGGKSFAQAPQSTEVCSRDATAWLRKH